MTKDELAQFYRDHPAVAVAYTREKEDEARQEEEAKQEEEEDDELP